MNRPRSSSPSPSRRLIALLVAVGLAPVLWLTVSPNVAEVTLSGYDTAESVRDAPSVTEDVYAHVDDDLIRRAGRVFLLPATALFSIVLARHRLRRLLGGPPVRSAARWPAAVDRAPPVSA